MYEAAVAYFQATGKRSFLEIALKNADLIDSIFGADKLHDVPGHQEIEIGLLRLYRLTGEERYLRLARFFLDERGMANGRQIYGPYVQDHLPVTDQREAVGHAVRAGYMYAAMTDIAAVMRATRITPLQLLRSGIMSSAKSSRSLAALARATMVRPSATTTSCPI